MSHYLIPSSGRRRRAILPGEYQSVPFFINASTAASILLNDWPAGGAACRRPLEDAILHLSEFQISAVIRTLMAGKLVEYLATARIGERGTLTLPKDYRDALNLQTGAALTLLRIGDGLMLIPEQKRFDELCDRIATGLEHAGVSEAALQATLPEVRERLARRRYPELFSGKRRKAGSKKR